ncbi:hypothetical protein ACVWWD_004617 [Mesorhizobium sp. URHB0026]
MDINDLDKLFGKYKKVTYPGSSSARLRPELSAFACFR